MKQNVFALLIFSAVLSLTPSAGNVSLQPRSTSLSMGWGCRPMRCPDSDKPLEVSVAATALDPILAV